MKNKVGGLFAYVTAFTVIILLVSIGYSFGRANDKIDTGVNALENLTDVYARSDRLRFYLEEAAKLSAAQALYAITAQAAVNLVPCFTKSYEDKRIILWSQNCKPELDWLKQQFLNEFNKSFNAFIARYPENLALNVLFSLENNTAIVTITTFLAEKQRAAYAIYSLNYSLNQVISFNLSIPLEDFIEIYQKTTAKLEECKNKTEPSELEGCLEELSFEHWDLDVKVLKNWALFELSTMQHFFFEVKDKMHFKPLQLHFGLAL